MHLNIRHFFAPNPNKSGTYVLPHWFRSAILQGRFSRGRARRSQPSSNPRWRSYKGKGEDEASRYIPNGLIKASP